MPPTPALDRAADTADAAAGHPLPEQRLADQARLAQVQAERRSEAAQGTLRQAQDDLARSFASTHDTWLPKQEQSVAEQRAAVRSQLRPLAQTIDDLHSSRRNPWWLRSFPTGGGSVLGVRFDAPTGSQALAHQLEAALATSSPQSLRTTTVPADLLSLLSAVASLIDEKT